MFTDLGSVFGFNTFYILTIIYRYRKNIKTKFGFNFIKLETLMCTGLRSVFVFNVL